METLAILAVVPMLGIIFMGLIITRETWIGGQKWPEWTDLWLEKNKPVSLNSDGVTRSCSVSEVIGLGRDRSVSSVAQSRATGYSSMQEESVAALHTQGKPQRIDRHPVQVRPLR